MKNLEHEKYLRRCVEISLDSLKKGNHPFGALIVDEEGNIIAESGNVEVTEKECTGHAETTVMKKAAKPIFKGFFMEMYTLFNG